MSKVTLRWSKDSYPVLMLDVMLESKAGFQLISVPFWTVAKLLSRAV